MTEWGVRFRVPEEDSVVTFKSKVQAERWIKISDLVTAYPDNSFALVSRQVTEWVES